MLLGIPEAAWILDNGMLEGIWFIQKDKGGYPKPGAVIPTPKFTLKSQNSTTKIPIFRSFELIPFSCLVPVPPQEGAAGIGILLPELSWEFFPRE